MDGWMDLSSVAILSIDSDGSWPALDMLDSLSIRRRPWPWPFNPSTPIDQKEEQEEQERRRDLAPSSVADFPTLIRHHIRRTYLWKAPDFRFTI